MYSDVRLWVHRRCSRRVPLACQMVTAGPSLPYNPLPPTKTLFSGGTQPCSLAVLSSTALEPGFKCPPATIQLRELGRVTQPSRTTVPTCKMRVATVPTSLGSCEGEWPSTHQCCHRHHPGSYCVKALGGEDSRHCVWPPGRSAVRSLGDPVKEHAVCDDSLPETLKIPQIRPFRTPRLGATELQGRLAVGGL